MTAEVGTEGATETPIYDQLVQERDGRRPGDFLGDFPGE